VIVTPAYVAVVPEPLDRPVSQAWAFVASVTVARRATCPVFAKPADRSGVGAANASWPPNHGSIWVL
jgi:hypothetical protein